MTNAAFAPIHAGENPSAEHIAHILDGLRHRTLPKQEWTNAAHYTAAAALLEEQRLAGAKAAMPDMIRDYNIATGGENTDAAGYHHTITIFLLKAINRFLSSRKTATLAENVALLLSSDLIDKQYMLRFYSADLLFSIEARRDWVAPDLKNLNED
jgi:hypothetical protein